jgi:hypothetical protein
MSKNIVDAVISWNDKYDNSVGIIASRRQIDIFGGYVNNWTTKNFTKYVKNKNSNVVVCRDHGGIAQGKSMDDGYLSFMEDAQCMNVIHIDPFKELTFNDCIQYTAKAIHNCASVNGGCFFEIGTEEAISYIDADDLDSFIMKLKSMIPEYFSRVVYVVIQSGTSLKSGKNIGKYDEKRLMTMINICRKHGLLSKEHNGDYLGGETIKNKFELGLSAINIAPEVAHIETEFVLQFLSNPLIDKWFEMCVKDGSWKKWFPQGFNPEENKREVLRLCGHYTFNYLGFEEIFDLNSVSKYVEENVHNFINERLL